MNKEVISHVIEVKRKYTDKELLEFGRKFADSMGTIFDKQAELKEFSTDIKATIQALEQVINNCAEQIKKGYEMTSVDCFVSYNEKIATFTNKITGEIIETREMTEEEQLRLSGKWVDADQLIRNTEE
jgi:uncharacterized FlaG/YvyC family protein